MRGTPRLGIHLSALLPVACQRVHALLTFQSVLFPLRLSSAERMQMGHERSPCATLYLSAQAHSMRERSSRSSTHLHCLRRMVSFGLLGSNLSQKAIEEFRDVAEMNIDRGLHVIVDEEAGEMQISFSMSTNRMSQRTPQMLLSRPPATRRRRT